MKLQKIMLLCTFLVPHIFSAIAEAQVPLGAAQSANKRIPPAPVKVSMQEAFVTYCKLSTAQCSNYVALGIELIRSIDDLDFAAHLSKDEREYFKRRTDIFATFPVWLVVDRIQLVPTMRGADSIHVIDATTGHSVKSGGIPGYPQPIPNKILPAIR